jgi:Transposase DDE domain
MRLYNLPDRRIFDRRFKTIPVKEMISNMGKRFVSEGFADSSTTIVAVDSSLIHAKNKRVWHKSTMKNNMMVPRSGIDVDARWGFSRNKGWIFGYKLHLSCSTSKLIVPLSVDFTTANISDNQMYRNLIESLPNETQYVCYI